MSRVLIPLALAITFAVVPFASAADGEDWHIAEPCLSEHAGAFGRGIVEVGVRRVPESGYQNLRDVRLRSCIEATPFEINFRTHWEYASIYVQALPLRTPGRQTDFLIAFVWEDGPPYDYWLMLEEDNYVSKVHVNSISWIPIDDFNSDGIWEVWLPVGSTVTCDPRGKLKPRTVVHEAEMLEPRLCLRNLGAVAE